jgi:hypothetical protein
MKSRDDDLIFRQMHLKKRRSHSAIFRFFRQQMPKKALPAPPANYAALP